VQNQISLNPSAIARSLGVVALLLAIASVVTQLAAYLTSNELVLKLSALFYLDAEQNLPTFFSSCLLLFTAVLLAIVTLLEKTQAAARVRYWAILSFGLLFMAIDEIVSLHEKLIMPFRKLLGNSNLGIFYFAWVIPAIVLIIFLAAFFWRFLFCLAPKMRSTFLLAATIYLLGCIGCELIGGSYAEIHGVENLIYGAISTVEESLEMLGIIIALWGLMTYINDNYQQVQFVFAPVRKKG
jgi:hypothetical protein